MSTEPDDFITDTDEIIAAAVDPALIRESLDLDAIQALVDATTEGPWYAQPRSDAMRPDAVVSPRADFGRHIPAECHQPEDAEFIAQARTLVPALIAELRGTRAERDGYKARGRVYEGKVQTLRDDIRTALANYDLSPTLADFNAALEGGEQS